MNSSASRVSLSSHANHVSKTVSQSYQAPKAILETVLYCDDLVAAGEFYEQVIGLELLSHEPNRHRFYQVGGSMLLIFQPNATEQMTVQIGGQVIPKHGAHGPGHMAFAVDEIEMDTIRRRLNDHGVGIESAIDWPTGGRSLYCRDPARNSIEFATRSLWFRSN